MKFLACSLLTLTSLSAFASCPVHLRFAHGEPFRDGAVDVRVNGETLVSSLNFRGVTSYLSTHPGHKTVDFVDAQSGKVLESKTFVAGTNLGYTVVLGGPAKGPEGMEFGNSTPIVTIDDISPVSNPNRWKGTWYRMSETNVVIDFRISDGNDTALELARLHRKENRASYQMGDFPKGTYQFNPVFVGSTAPLFNPALEVPRNVELRGVVIEGGLNVDVFALGNFLGKTPNSLDIHSVSYRPKLSETGCILIK